MALDRWDTMSVVCIKTISGLKEGNHYKVTGQGDLSFNNDPAVGDRKGWGLCVVEDCFDYKKLKSLPSKNHYFTIDELEEHFINDEEAFRIHQKQEQRDLKIEKVLYGNR